MINHTSLARSVLGAKSVNVEGCREMGRRNRGPYPPETCRKVSDACRFIKSLWPKRACTTCRAQGALVANCIVEHADIERPSTSPGSIR